VGRYGRNLLSCRRCRRKDFMREKIFECRRLLPNVGDLKHKSVRNNRKLDERYLIR